VGTSIFLCYIIYSILKHLWKRERNEELLDVIDDFE